MQEGVITSVIKTTPVGVWYIELTDLTDSQAEVRICRDIEEYAEAIEAMGEPYGGMIEIRWDKDEAVTPEQINEVRMQMHAYEAKQAAIANGEIQEDSHLAPYVKGLA